MKTAKEPNIVGYFRLSEFHRAATCRSRQCKVMRKLNRNGTGIVCFAMCFLVLCYVTPHVNVYPEERATHKPSESGNEPTTTLRWPQHIPRTVHFFVPPGSIFRLENFLAVKSAWIHIKPEQVTLHYLLRPPFENRWLKDAGQFVTSFNCLCCSIRNAAYCSSNASLTTAPSRIQVSKNQLFYHKAKFTNLKFDILRRYRGGIYLDLDVITFHPLENFLPESAYSADIFIASKEGPGSRYTLPDSFMASSSNSSFIKCWQNWYNNYTSNRYKFDADLSPALYSGDVPKATRVIADKNPESNVQLLPHRSIYWPLARENGIQQVVFSKNLHFSGDPSRFAVKLHSDVATGLFDNLTESVVGNVDSSLFKELRPLLGIEPEKDYGFSESQTMQFKTKSRMPITNDLKLVLSPSMVDYFENQPKLIGKWRFGAANIDDFDWPKFTDLTSREKLDAYISPLNGFQPLNPGAVFNKSVSSTFLQGGDHIYIGVEGIFDVNARSFRFSMHVNMVPIGNIEESSATIVEFEFSDCSEVEPDDVKCGWLTLRLERPYDGSLKLLLQKDNMMLWKAETTGLFASEWSHLDISCSQHQVVLFVNDAKLAPSIELMKALEPREKGREVLLRAIWIGMPSSSSFEKPNWHKANKSSAAMYIAGASLFDRPIHNDKELLNIRNLEKENRDGQTGPMPG